MNKKINLVRQNYLQPNMKELNAMRKDLEALINSDLNYNEEWNALIKEIIQFQYEDGSFNLLDSYHIESDCRVLYCHEPTYICSALLIKALLNNKDVFTGKEDIILSKALHMCCARRLQGHGYDSMDGQIKAINYFMKCNIKDFLKKYPNICPEFTEMFQMIKECYSKYEKEQGFFGPWGANYKDDILKINRYFNSMPVFVYGTLMKNQSNHDDYLADSHYVGAATLSGYEIYDLGCYPGIVEGTGKVYGEVYDINENTLKAMDRLEGEGSLYIRKSVKVTLADGNYIDAWCYIYNHSIEGCNKVFGRYGQDESIWYVAYGSNLFEERIKYYIEGGLCIYNGRRYRGCKDKTLYSDTRPVMIPYDMYYSNYNRGSWKNSAVSFLDLSRPGKAYGRAYKIKRSQLEDIHLQEGTSSLWYPDCIQLDDIDGLPAYTASNYQVKQKDSFNKVSAEYGYVLFKGLKETYPELSDDDIYSYLKNCGE